MKFTTKYAVKKGYFIAYLFLLGICILLTVIRWMNVFNSQIVVINSEVNSHISNLSLSMILYLSIGYSWLLSGVKFRYVTVLGVFLLLANLISETIMGFMNTTDIMDAVYGTIGVAVSFVYLFLTQKYGLHPIDPEG